MDINKAKELIEKTDRSFSERHQIMKGLQILAKYENDVDCYFEHDRIYASNFEETVSKMSEDDVLQMAKLGWFHDEENEYWTHF